MSSGIQQDNKYDLLTVTVKGDSMQPIIRDGDNVTFQKFTKQKLSIGMIILCNHPILKRKKIVKRISQIIEDSIFIKGDNALYSSDSRSFGPIKTNQIIGLYKE
tara:strand:- start:557 stop:868 length:312 start_codon:yes stop_codon:yes gene_type:complete